MTSKKMTPDSVTEQPAAPLVAYKGFNRDWSCRGAQYAIGDTVSQSGVIRTCENGLHACKYPLSVLEYYPPASSVYAAVECSGDIHDPGHEDTKIAAARIKVTAELSISDLVQRAWVYVWSRCKVEGKVATGISGAASATGDRGAASATGDRGAASATGDSGAASATGTSGAASATGYSGAASATGDSGAASATGISGAASATGYRGAASATGYRGAASATGTSGAASATGDSGAASATGTSGAASATGTSGAAFAGHPTAHASASGPLGRAAGVSGATLTLRRYSDDCSRITHVWSGIVGQNGIEPATYYTLDEDGRPVGVAGEVGAP